jgi:hypothetical protein
MEMVRLALLATEMWTTKKRRKMKTRRTRRMTRRLYR